VEKNKIGEGEENGYAGLHGGEQELTAATWHWGLTDQSELYCIPIRIHRPGRTCVVPAHVPIDRSSDHCHHRPAAPLMWDYNTPCTQHPPWGYGINACTLGVASFSVAVNCITHSDAPRD
jgi:hypothetical protein